jgi:uncharacterized protein (TIGR02466 family)
MFAKSDVVGLFPSSIWLHEIADCAVLNADLVRAVQEIRAGDEGHLRDDGGGWGSPSDLLEREAFAPFAECVVEAAASALEYMRFKFEHFYISECWANWNDDGDIHPRHSHPNCFLSGVYYVKAPEGCGDIVFHDPRPQAAVLYPQLTENTNQNSDRHYVTPFEGMMILFPSWLEHSVTKNTAGADRLSISFNVMLSGEIGHQSGRVTL